MPGQKPASRALEDLAREFGVDAVAKALTSPAEPLRIAWCSCHGPDAKTAHAEEDVDA